MFRQTPASTCDLSSPPLLQQRGPALDWQPQREGRRSRGDLTQEWEK
jgi:hypothetical protein